MKNGKTKKEEQLNQMRHRYRMLLAKDMGLMLFQIMGIAICAYYVYMSCMGFQIKGFEVNVGNQILQFKSGYMKVLCFILSIFLLLSRPKLIRERITDLKLAIKYISSGEELASYQEMLVTLAESYIEEVDVAYSKKKSGQVDKIEPHEKRMVFRWWMIVLSIPVISILSAILVFICGMNIPQMAAVDLLIGYILVICEAHYYQVVLKKAGIFVLMENHKKIIVNQEIKEESFYLYQKICYMKADRLSNYCKVLGVASATMNLISILITILQESKNADMQSLFALDIGDINSVIAIIFMVLSILFFIADFVVQYFIEPSIRELSINTQIPFSEENYEKLHKKYNAELKQDTLFSRKSLDWARGMYDYNNEAMVRKYCRNEDIKVPINCMFTVESSYPGRIPRYKLTALIAWLCSFLYFVWAEKDLNCIIPISIFSIFLYDVLIVYNMVKLWNNNHKWLAYEKALENEVQLSISWDIKWDVLDSLLAHAGIAMCLFVLFQKNNYNYVISILLIVLIIIFIVLGKFFNKNKKDWEVNIFLKWCQVIHMVLGVTICIFQYIFERGTERVCAQILLIGLIFGGLQLLMSFYKRMQDSVEGRDITCPVPCIILIIVWTIGLMLEIKKMYGNMNDVVMLLQCLYGISINIWLYGVVYGMVQMWKEKEAC